MSHGYTPYYCEENVWWLLKDTAPNDGHAVFICNPYGSVALWSQRASERTDGLTLWDYHVVALGRVDGAWHIFDLDCLAGSPLLLHDWVGATFPFAGAVPEDVEPMFRVVPASELFEHFQTDRSHMRTNDGWLAPPPPWNPLGGKSNLASYTDVAESDARGTVLTLEELLAHFR